LSQLEDRERTHPQPRMSVEPTGPERAAPPQERVVHPERTAPARPNLPHLTKERVALGQALAKRESLTYVSEPTKFWGWAVDCGTAPSGREYARIENYARGEFTLIPKPPGWERLHGHTVNLALDREQKLVIQRDLGLSR
jgi:hypothetical protein